jgi:uncharacterized protein YijF (DUF1287 family)
MLIFYKNYFFSGLCYDLPLKGFIIFSFLEIVLMCRKIIVPLILVWLCNINNACFAQEVITFNEKLVEAALERAKHSVKYDGSYVKIDYPMGDVPANTGVCTDVVIRSYRALGIDLQQKVHEDMEGNFSLYPNNWGLTKTDTNIDHRRVPNLQVFFSRHGKKLKITESPEDYKPGDIVTWNVSSWWRGRRKMVPHIGLVSDKKSLFGDRYKIVHNIGMGPELEDMLFRYPITGHYRYNPLEVN